MAVSLQRNEIDTEINTAVDPNVQTYSIATARSGRSRSRSQTRSTRTATTQSGRSQLGQTESIASSAIGYLKYAGLMMLTAINLYVQTLVNVFHVAYFSYRKPAVSKDLIKTTYHLMRISYDANLLSINEIYQITSSNLIGPMARQNQHHYHEQNSQIRTMKTGSISSRR